jgi:TM2 domain-containing membrane protein YozV
VTVDTSPDQSDIDSVPNPLVRFYMTVSLVPSSGASEKSRGVALALAAVLGPFGAHRFYVGKTGTGLLMLCTLGGAGLWYLYDLIVVAGGSFRDAKGRLVSIWDPEGPTESHRDVPQEILEELSALRSEVAELAERVDFAERLLAQPRAAEDHPYPPLKR